jgi:hypothetical protein
MIRCEIWLDCVDFAGVVATFEALPRTGDRIFVMVDGAKRPFTVTSVSHTAWEVSASTKRPGTQILVK